MSTVEYPQLSDFARFSALSLEECGRMFADLRAHRPVAFFPEPEVPFLERGPGYYAVTRYDDVVAVSRKPRGFRSGVMFAELLRRIPDLRTTAELRRLQSMFINGVKYLPAVFTPAGPRVRTKPTPAAPMATGWSWRRSSRRPCAARRRFPTPGPA